MANTFFKMNRGNKANLPATLTDGHAYFCIDTAEFFIDYADSNGILYRKKINAKDAETLTGISLDQIKEYNLTQFYTKTEVNNKVAEAKAYTDANSFKVVKVDILPGTGDKSTIYVKDSEEFIWVGSGTPVPNDGSVIDTVYFNISKTAEEVNAIVRGANLPFVSGFAELPIYPVCLVNNIALCILNGDSFYTIGWENLANNTSGIIYSSLSDSWRVNSYDFNGVSPAEFQGIQIGTHNDKLVELISATPFEEKTWEKLGPSLEGYATEEYVDNAIANIPEVDLSGYVKLSDLPALLDEYMQWGKFKDLV